MSQDNIKPISEDKPIKPLISLTQANSHSGRARCKECSCLTIISTDHPRVELPMYVQGRTVTACYHLSCFLTKGLSVEITNKNNAGKCKVSNKAILKNEFRCLIRAGNAKFGLGLLAACNLLDPIMKEYGISGKDIIGGEALEGELGKRWREVGSMVRNSSDSLNLLKSPEANQGNVSNSPTISRLSARGSSSTADTVIKSNSNANSKSKKGAISSSMKKPIISSMKTKTSTGTVTSKSTTKKPVMKTVAKKTIK